VCHPKGGPAQSWPLLEVIISETNLSKGVISLRQYLYETTIFDQPVSEMLISERS
jgi:hypothetical protein